jgi:hypothetical protein
LPLLLLLLLQGTHCRCSSCRKACRALLLPMLLLLLLLLRLTWQFG